MSIARGTGLSDPVPHVPTLEERMEDLHAVLDAAGSERPALLGVSEGGPMSISFAATHPERMSSLIIYGSSPRFSSSEGFLPERREFFARVRRDTRSIVEHWGEGRSLELFWPSVAGDEAWVPRSVNWMPEPTNDLKGVPGRWTLLAVEPPDPASSQTPASRAAPDRLAPNLETARVGDRMALRIVGHTPAVARFINRASSGSRPKHLPRA